MQFDSRIWVRAVSAWFPPQRESSRSAIESRRLSPESAILTGVTALPVAVDIAAPDMAVNAARIALNRGECKAREIDVLVHSWIYYQGHDLWSPPHYIANQIGAVNCLPISVHQGCDGGALAIQQAALRLLTGETESVALVTASDRFAAPGIDRWNTQPSLALGDCGTAIVLSKSDRPAGPFRLEAVRTRTTVAFEVINRGTAPFGDYPMAGGLPVDMRTITDDTIEELGSEYVYQTARAQVETLLFETLAEAGIEDYHGKLRLVVLPRVGTNTIDAIYLPILERLTGVMKARYDHATGHLGCSDWAADLNDLYERDVLQPGDYAVLIGAGGGFTWMCAVVKAFEV